MEQYVARMLERLNTTAFPEGRDDNSSPEPLTNQAVRTLRDDIICGKLKPGARLRASKLRLMPKWLLCCLRTACTQRETTFKSATSAL